MEARGGADEINATSPTGATVLYTASATDEIDPAPSVTCASASGSAFPIGVTTVSCTATDAAGNTATGPFTVRVKSTADQIDDLRTLVESLNLKQGIENSLDAKLKTIQEALASAQAGDLTAACNKLDSFLNEVEAQAGKSITQAEAERLIADATRIKAVIGCG